MDDQWISHTIDIELVVRNFQPVAAIDNLHGERLVEFPKIDVIHLQPVTMQKLWHCKHRTDTHLVRFAARNRRSTINTQRLEAAFCGHTGFHDYDRRCAVGQLTRVTGRDVAVFTNRFETGKPFQRG